MFLPNIHPENMIYPSGDVILEFHEHPSRRLRRQCTKSGIFLRASSAALHVSVALRCMVRDAKLKHADEYASNGFMIIGLPCDDWQAFAFILLVIRGATEEEMDERRFDMLSLVQLTTLADKYDLAWIIEPHGDYFINRAREFDETGAMRHLGTYIWAAHVFGASKSHWELTAMAQSNCIGFRTFKISEDKSEEETSVTPLPRWVMDEILKKRLAAFSIIRESLNDTQKDLTAREQKFFSTGDMSYFAEFFYQSMAIYFLAKRLGVPQHGKLTEKKVHGCSFNKMLTTLHELQHTPLEHGCLDMVGNVPCPHKSFQAVAAQADAEDAEEASKKKEEEEKEKMFDPVGHILERLSSSEAWEEQGSKLGWGFGLGQVAGVKDEEPEDLVLGKILKRKRV